MVAVRATTYLLSEVITQVAVADDVERWTLRDYVWLLRSLRRDGLSFVELH